MSEEYVNELANSSSSCADLNIQCTPCKEDGDSEPAIKFCADCKEHLCSACIKYHRKFAATRDHKLFDRDVAEEIIVGFQTVTRKITCRIHPSKEISKYCPTHDMVFCVLCIATDHRNCKNVSTLAEEVSHQTNIDLKPLIDEIGACLTLIKDTVQKKQNSLAKHDENQGKLLNEIENTRKELVDKINDLSELANEDLYVKTNETREQIQQDITLVKDIGKELSDTYHKMKSISDSDTEQAFIVLKTGKKELASGKEINGNIRQKSDETLIMEKNSFLKQVVAMKSLATLFTFKDSYKIKSIKNVNVKFPNEQNSTCSIVDLCQMSDGTFILADHEQRALKVLNDELQLIDLHMLESGPLGVFWMENNDVAVKLVDGVVLYDISKKLNVRKQITAKQILVGLVYRKGVYWVTSAQGLEAYDTDGKSIKIVQKTSITGNFQQMSFSRDSKCILVANLGMHGAVCYDIEVGEFTKKYCTDALKYSRGVCVATDGTVFVSGGESRNIIMFKEDGTYIGELLSAERCIERPCALLYDMHNHRLIVTSENANSIQVIDFA